MDALEKALAAIRHYEDEYLREENDLAEAQAYAAIAPAEELKRIADLLEALDSRDEFAESVRIWGGSQS